VGLRALSAWLFAWVVFLVAAPLQASGVDPTKISLPKGPDFMQPDRQSLVIALARLYQAKPQFGHS